MVRAAIRRGQGTRRDPATVRRVVLIRPHRGSGHREAIHRQGSVAVAVRGPLRELGEAVAVNGHHRELGEAVAVSGPLRELGEAVVVSGHHRELGEVVEVNDPLRVLEVAVVVSGPLRALGVAVNVPGRPARCRPGSHPRGRQGGG